MNKAVIFFLQWSLDSQNSWIWATSVNFNVFPLGAKSCEVWCSLHLQTVYSEKKIPKCFYCNISYKTWAMLTKFGTPFFGIDLLQNDVNVFHLNWIKSLHYSVKLEMLIGHLLPLSCYGKKLHNLFHYRPPNSLDFNSVDHVVGTIAREGG